MKSKFFLYCTLYVISINCQSIETHNEISNDFNVQTKNFISNTNENSLLDTSLISQTQNATYITINGSTYLVPHTEHDLRLAIYHAINANLWGDLSELIEIYQTLPNHQKQLVYMAQGLLERSRGYINKALTHMQRAYDINKEDLRVQLELARLYFEDYNNRQSKKIFNSLAQSYELPNYTKGLINEYQSAINSQYKWQGNIGLSIGYDSNINQGNGIRQCVFNFMDTCVIYRNLPPPIGSSYLGLNFDLSKRYALSDNNDLEISARFQGAKYSKTDSKALFLTDYSNFSSSAKISYIYRDSVKKIMLYPEFEILHKNKSTYYQSPSINLNTEIQLSRRLNLNSNFSFKWINYEGENKKYFEDYKQVNVGLGLVFEPSKNTFLYTNFDFYRNLYLTNYSSSKEQSIRIGAYKYLSSGVYLHALVMYRDTKNDVANFLSIEPRHDNTKIAILSIGLPKISFKGVVPELRFKYIQNKSNIDFYIYTQREISLNLNYSF